MFKHKSGRKGCQQDAESEEVTKDPIGHQNITGKKKLNRNKLKI